jgi:YVTN family beta-propeller protein
MLTFTAILSAILIILGLLAFIRPRCCTPGLIETIIGLGFMLVGVSLAIFALTLESGRTTSALGGVAVLPAGTRLYLPFGPTSSGSYYVSVIDAGSTRVITNVRVEHLGSPLFDSSGRRLYLGATHLVPTYDGILCESRRAAVPNWYLDTSSNKVVHTKSQARVEILSRSAGMCAASPRAGLVYAIRPEATASHEALSIIEISSRKIVANVEVGDLLAGDILDAVAVLPTGNRVYVAAADGNVFVIDTGTKKVVGSLTVGRNAGAEAVDPAGRRLYVTTEDAIAVIDTSTNRRVAIVKPCSPVIFWSCW